MDKSNKSLRLRRKLIDLSNPLIMCILNATPDSFFDKSRVSEIDNVLEKFNIGFPEGVKIFDIGGYSTRPGAEDVSQEEELNRVIPLIEAIIKGYPDTIISIDTFRTEVAYQALKSGASIVNDISGGDFDNKMLSKIIEWNLEFNGIGYVMMHIQGTPKTMQQNPTYNNVTFEVVEELSKKSQFFRENGFGNLIIDVGFGFGKTLRHNYELFGQIPYLKRVLDYPILVGISRKSMITKLLKVHQNEALTGTIALNTLALQLGANIIRVHDAEEASQVLKIVNFLNESI